MKLLREILNHPLAKNFFVYSFGALFLKGVSFLLLPLYTSLLSPAEYGVLDLLSTFSNILDVSLSIGLLSVIMIEYFHFDDSQRSKLFNNVLSVFLTISSALYLIALSFVLIFRERLFPGTEITLLVLVTATSYLTFFQSFIVLILKQQEKSRLVTTVQILSGSVSILLNVLFVYGWSWGISGIIWSGFIGVVGFSIYSWYFIIKKIGFSFHFDKAIAIQYLKLGLPFVPNALLLWLMTSANRWILLNYNSLEEVGYYSVAFKFSSLFEPLIIQPFLGAYTPRILKRFKSGDYEQPLRKIAFIGIPGFLIAGFAVQFIAQWMIDPAFTPSLTLIPVLLFANYFSLMAQVSAYILVFQKRIIPMLFAISSAAVIGVVCNFILVPIYGGMGSAIAGNISGLVWFGITFFLQKRERAKLYSNGH